ERRSATARHPAARRAPGRGALHLRGHGGSRARAGVGTPRRGVARNPRRAGRTRASRPRSPEPGAGRVTAPVLALERVSRSFAGKVAVHPLSLGVDAGCTTVLLGESGSGKSTLLRLMAGLISPDTGRVLFDGEPMTPEQAPVLRRRMGFGLQSGGLFPHLTAEENVTLLARALGRPAGWRRERVEHLRELVRLEPEMLQRWPLELSGGQRQRVSLMRALMLEPRVVLLDEP